MRFAVAGTAKPQGQLVRSPSGGLYNPKSVKQWRDDVKAIAVQSMAGKPKMGGPVHVELTFFIRRPKSHMNTKGGLLSSAPLMPIGRNSGDVDKLARAAFDAMTEVVFNDDSQVVNLGVIKCYSTDFVGVDVTVREIKEHA